MNFFVIVIEGILCFYSRFFFFYYLMNILFVGLFFLIFFLWVCIVIIGNCFDYVYINWSMFVFLLDL